ncbi:MAG: hypothetical protein UH241_04985, partial [Acutalibacteraceae bacterium]|nr:hypothetical protein [Acutalibacteraceae bacterium]
MLKTTFNEMLNKAKGHRRIVTVVSVMIIAVIILTLVSCTNSKERETEKTSGQIGTNAIEAITEKVTEKATQKATEANTEKSTELPTEKVTVKSTEKPTEKVTEKKSSSSSSASSKTSSTTSRVENNSSSKPSSSKPSSNNSTSSTVTSSSSTSNSSTGNTSSKPSTSNTTTNTGTTTSKPTKVWHEAEYKYIDHPAETKKVWVVDQEEYTYEEPIYEEHQRTICNDCGADITDDCMKHIREHMIAGVGASYRSETREIQVGTKTITVEEKGHYETVTVKEAWTEKV